MSNSFNQSLLDQLNSLSTLTETFELPTKGRLDGIDSKVTMRMMTTQEEKVRVGNKGSFWKVMSSIMNRCIVSPEGLDTYKLTVIDFIFLMYKLRILSYGKEYKVTTIKCPHPDCKSTLSNVSLDLDKLEVIDIDSMGYNFDEPFKVKLPKTGWEVDCRLLRINEYDEIQEESERILKDFPNYDGDPMIPLRLSRQIVKINGEKVEKLDPIIIRSIVDKLPAADENAIVQSFNKITMGIHTTSEYKCPRCGKMIYLPLSYSEEFFRPTTD